MSYTRALDRLRGLMLAQTALEEAVQEATRDVLDAVPDPVAKQAAAASLAPPSRRYPADSGIVPRVRSDFTKRALRAVGSADVERYVREAWERAGTDAARELVREMVRNSTASGSIEQDASERLLKLTG